MKQLYCVRRNQDWCWWNTRTVTNGSWGRKHRWTVYSWAVTELWHHTTLQLWTVVLALMGQNWWHDAAWCVWVACILDSIRSCCFLVADTFDCALLVIMTTMIALVKCLIQTLVTVGHSSVETDRRCNWLWMQPLAETVSLINTYCCSAVNICMMHGAVQSS